MSHRSHRRHLGLAAVVVAIALLASACSGSSEVDRSAAMAGNPVDLAALPAGTGSGERVPQWFAATVTPVSWVSTSTSPTLSVPGVSGAWTFTLSDLSDGTSSFGTRTYSEQGASTRVPNGLLKNGDMYVWTATSPGQQPVGGSFTVDVQMLQAQQTDSRAGIDVLLSSGEASFSWASHVMQAVAGPVGAVLRFQGSNLPSPGVPAGWNLVASSSSPYLSVVTRSDGSVGLVAKNGQVSSYKRGPGDTWNPVQLAGEGLDASGTSPALLANADGSWSVTTKASTSRFVDDNGDGTADLESLSANGSPVVNQVWTGGLLRKITDPVSGRSIDLIYGGGSCPKTAAGFVAAPTGMLCQITFWDGSTSAISYVSLPDGSVSIGRLADFPEAGASGAMVTDVAYDTAGRLARVRSPLVAGASASSIIGADDAQYWTEIAYTPEGRVSTLTEPAATIGAQRCVRNYTNEGTFSVVSDSCLGRAVEQVLFDGSTFFPLAITDVTGRTSTNQWDLSAANLLSTSDYTGRITNYTYENGNIVRSQGPSRDLSTAQVAVRQYDESFAQSAEGVPMRGLDVVYWPSDTDRSAESVSELGPLKGGTLLPSLTVNWDASPAGNTSGGWSALMTGTLTITTPGAYTFNSGNSNAKLRVANYACETNACSALDLPSGPVSLRVELSSATQNTSMDLTWSGPDTGGGVQSIPTDRLHPQYGFVTETKVFDPTATQSAGEVVSRSVYANPADGLVTSTTNTAGAVSAVTYEDAGWERVSGSVLPSGNVLRQEWWGDRESAKSPCPGASSVNQGGGIKASVTPGPDGGNGPSTQQWYTASGAIAATQIVGGGTRCLTYDKAGRVIATEVVGLGRSVKASISHAVDGNPLITSITETDGTSTTTSTFEVDLAGREVRSVDRFGVVTITNYDQRTGAVASVSSAPPNGTTVVQSFSYDEFGRQASVSIDGRVVAKVSYDQLGLAQVVEFGNGARTTMVHDATDAMVAKETVSGSNTYATVRRQTGGGIASSDSLSANGTTSSMNYTHDSSGRLASISLTKGLASASKSWTFGYDANSNRTSQSVAVDGAPASSFSYDYDQSDRLVSSTDPTAAGITYDDRGNATKVGTASLTYDAMNLLTSATDGATTVEFARSSEGSIIGRSTTDAQGTGTIRYASQGLVLDDQGRVLAQGFELPGGVLVSRGSDGALTWTHTSLSGDRFFVLNDAGAQVGSVSGYSPFGEQIIGEKPVASDVSVGWQATNSADSLGMTTGLVVMGQRVYVPSLGRFIQIDPVVSGSANSYDFANQDPTSFKDPTGRAAEDSTWLITGIASVLLAIGTLAVSVKATAGMTKLFGAVKGRIYGGLVGGAAGLVIGGVAAGTGLALGLDPTQALTIVGTSVLAGVAGGAFIKKSGAAKLASSSGRNSDEVAGAGARSPRAAVRGEEAAALFAPQVPVPKVATVVPQRLKITPPSEQVSVYRLWANPRTGRLL